MRLLRRILQMLLVMTFVDFLPHGGRLRWGLSILVSFPNPLEKYQQICNNKYMSRQHGVMNVEDVKTFATQGIEPNGGGGFKL